MTISSSRSRPGRRCAALALAAAALLAQGRALAFSFNDVVNRAKQLSAQPYQRPNTNLPQVLQDLGYEKYNAIRFKGERAYWAKDKLPFELEFFHEGVYYNQPVKINEIAPYGVHEIRYNPADFDFGDNQIDPNQLKDLSFSGFRVHYGINTSKLKEEMLVFRGASYFRGVGKGQRYGLSARGVAIDTGLLSGEEFPRFSEFWLVRPKPADKDLTIYALLDSKSITGAYRFIVHPGDETAMEVKSRIFMRQNVSKLGLAPLTSMYLFGDNQHPTGDDYRPEVHDSDGLSMHTGTGEWIWRPLVNPKRLQVTSFAMTNPQGFGLMQRDRSFHDYEDLDLRYDLRPSRPGSGAPAGSSWSTSPRRTRPTTTWSPTGCRTARRRPASSSTWTTPCAGRATRTPSRTCRGCCRPAAAAASPATRTTASPTPSTSSARRWTSSRPTPRSRASSRSVPTASCWSAAPCTTTSPTAGA